MLLPERTLEQFGYLPETLTKWSKKSVIVSCDYCNDEFQTYPSNRLLTRKIIETDCCKKCKSIKVGDLNMLKFGVRNVFELQSVKDKIVAKNIEIYGVARPTQNQAIKDKVKNTLVERYGVTNPMAIEGIEDRRKEACLEKYGVENPSSVPEFKEKRKKTCVERFGKETYLGSKHCLEKTEEKFGVDNVFKLEEYQEVAKQSKIDSGLIKIHQGKSVQEWSEDLGFSRQYLNSLINKLGWEQSILCIKRCTNIEMVIREILERNNIEYIFDKSLKGYRPDFIIGNLIIECDGLYYHSELFQPDDEYHAKKKQFYDSEGFDSLFFREDEILNKSDIIESIILDRLNLNTKIDGNSLDISEIDCDIANKFLLENQLNDFGEGNTCIGLSRDNELMCLMQLNLSGGQWEISRFATKVNHNIVGGFSRLLSFFTGGFAPEKLITFIDLRYGLGEYLTKLDFVKEKPYPSFKWTDGTNTFHRMRFPSNSGRDSGLYKIWDCGQLKFVR